jgi:flagellar basal body-associated protein FliL
MAAEQKRQEPPEGDAPKKKPSKQTGTANFKAKLAVYALPTALIVSIVANLAGVFYFRALAQGASPVATPEVALGEYHFVAEEHEPGQVTEAEFTLHIELVRQAEKPARRLLEARRQKVRQNVEELLRTAHGGDFNDPALKQLKSQLQKRLNETLGIRAVADVIVTELRMERTVPTIANERVSERETGQSVPWVEPANG